MNMVKRRGTSYQSDFRWGGNRIRRDFATEHEALEWEGKAKARLESGVPLTEVVHAPSAMTLDDLLETVRVRCWAGTPNAENSTRNAEDVVEILGGHRAPGEITASDVDRAVGVLVGRGLSNATVNRKLAALSKMFSFAVSRGLVDRKPHIERKREPQGRLRWFTEAEEQQILELAKGDWQDVIVFLLDTGCRLSEAWAVRKGDVDDVYVRFEKTKNGRSRAVPMTQRLKGVIHARKAQGGGRTDPLFPGWDNHRVAREWAKVRTAMGLDKDKEAVPHALRHTCASRLAQGGVPVQTIQQWLGHRTLTMTLRYAHLAPANLMKASEVLGGAA